MFRLHRNCRACNSSDLTPVFDLGLQPLANDFCGGQDEHAGYAPLQVLYCNECSLAQLSVVVRPDILFSKYAYVTSSSLTMDRHFAVLAQDIISQQEHIGNVIEIGSNDGRFLHYLKERGATGVLGVDPAQNLAAAANVNGIPTLGKMFDIPTAEQVKRMMPTPDVIVARHVFCHVPNWHEFLDALQVIAGPRTLVVIEVPHAEKMLRQVEFDTIYHEHASYLTIKAMKALLAGSNLAIDQIGNYTIHGGTIGLFLRYGDNNGYVDNVTREDWRQFSIAATNQIEALRDAVRARSQQGKRVCGIGASAKGTVWMNACRFRSSEIQFVTDNTPLKLGKTVPGTDIPVVPEEELKRADYAVLFAWNYRDELLEKFGDWHKAGGRFIVPVPQLEIV